MVSRISLITADSRLFEDSLFAEWCESFREMIKSSSSMAPLKTEWPDLWLRSQIFWSLCLYLRPKIFCSFKNGSKRKNFWESNKSWTLSTLTTRPLQRVRIGCRNELDVSVLPWLRESRNCVQFAVEVRDFLSDVPHFDLLSHRLKAFSRICIKSSGQIWCDL